MRLVALNLVRVLQYSRPYSVGASIFWPQRPMNDQFDPSSQFEQHSPPFKRPRNSEENQSNSRMQPSNIPINKGVNNIFFKTRMCAKFKIGMCRNGASCNFAHGTEDMRQPPPNWQELVGREEDQLTGNWNDDQKIIHKMKLCRKFYNGEECPYGERCNFLHEDPSKYRDDSRRYRESSAISIGTTVTLVVNGSGLGYSEGNNRPVNNTGSEASRLNMMKPSYWKTKLCVKWETTGHCPFGDKCHFAHGQTELQMHCGWEGEPGNFVVVSTNPQAVSVHEEGGQSSNEEGKSKGCLLKWKGAKKIDRIYADWLDDVPLLLHNLPSKVDC